jgi:phytoene synthase
MLEQRVQLPELRVVIETIMEEARRRYALGESGIRLLDPKVRFSITLAAALYSRILDKIERRDYDVFAGRAHLGTIEKWTMAMPAYMQHRYLARRQGGD